METFGGAVLLWTAGISYPEVLLLLRFFQAFDDSPRKCGNPVLFGDLFVMRVQRFRGETQSRRHFRIAQFWVINLHLQNLGLHF